jgi:hypothetical protein
MINITGLASEAITATGGITLQKPMWLLWIIPALIITFYLISRTFVEVREDQSAIARRRRARRTMYVTRTIIIILLVVAFATPTQQQEKTIQSDPFVKILVDNSSSMGIYDMAAVGKLQDALMGSVAVKTGSIAEGERSAI